MNTIGTTEFGKDAPSAVCKLNAPSARHVSLDTLPAIMLQLRPHIVGRREARVRAWKGSHSIATSCVLHKIVPLVALTLNVYILQ